MYVTQLTGAQRKWRDVQQEYHAAGERSVSSTAHRVGFQYQGNKPKSNNLQSS